MMKNVAALVLALSAGCSTDADTAFHVSGRVGGSVTHVVATTPSHVSAQRIAARVGNDGSFDLELAPGSAWVVAFADSTQTGAAMLAGTLQVGSLDALVPHDAGSLDLGTVTFENGRAKANASSADIAAALGIDRVTATRLGATDDLATRYANPDVDNDGTIDALQDGHDFRLDLYGQLRVTVGGRDASLDDLVRGNLTAANAGVHYLQTGIVASVPKMFANEMPNALFAFDQTYYGVNEGPQTAAVEAGTPIGQPELKIGAVDGYPTAAVYTASGHDMPRGDYQVAIGSTQLTFADVRPSADAQLASGADQLLPFMQITPTEAGCRTDCQIASVGYTWMRNTAEGWVPAAAGELTKPARVEIIRAHGGKSQYLTAEMPATPSAKLAWSSMKMSAGMLPTDLAGVSTSELCYVMVSYDDEVGMQMTSVVSNPDPNCAAL